MADNFGNALLLQDGCIALLQDACNLLLQSQAKRGLPLNSIILRIELLNSRTVITVS